MIWPRISRINTVNVPTVLTDAEIPNMIAIPNTPATVIQGTMLAEMVPPVRIKKKAPTSACMKETATTIMYGPVVLPIRALIAPWAEAHTPAAKANNRLKK